MKNAPNSFNTMQTAAQTITRRAWRNCHGDYPIAPELRAEAERYLAQAELKARNRKQPVLTDNEKKATANSLVVLCEYNIANWREASGRKVWPIPGVN